MTALRFGIAVTTVAGFIASLGPADAHRQAGSEARGARAVAAAAGPGPSRVTLCLNTGLAYKYADIWNDPDPRIRASLLREYPAFEGRVRPGSRYCE